jgi:hypothetical protein
VLIQAAAREDGDVKAALGDAQFGAAGKIGGKIVKGGVPDERARQVRCEVRSPTPSISEPSEWMPWREGYAFSNA